MTRLVCPRCRDPKRVVESGDRYFPFCSRACKEADLRGWFEEDYRVGGRTIEEAEALGEEWPEPE